MTWQTKKLGEICDKASSSISQNQLKNENGKYPIYGAGGFIKNISFYHQDRDYISIITDGAGIGRIALLPAMSSVIGTLQYLIPKENVDIKFLYYILSSFDFLKYKNGATIPHIYFREYSEEEFLVPPLSEQKRIVKKLDEVFEKATQAKENAEKNLQNSKELFESYLQSVFANPGKDWGENKLEVLTSKIGSGATPRGGKNSYKKSGIALVRSMNVYDRNFVDKNLAFIDDDQAKDLANVTLAKGDVLLNITGASVTRCCVLPKEYLPARVNQHVSILRPKQDVIDSAFLNYLLTSKPYKNQLQVIGGRGATRQAITKLQLENFLIRYPLLMEQKTIVKKLNMLSVETKKLEKIYEQKLADFEELKKSVLKSAFAGEF